MLDGQLTDDGSGRWCISCNRDHGFLYVCPNYCEELKKQLVEQGKVFRELCHSGEMPVQHVNKNGEIIWEGKLKDLK